MLYAVIMAGGRGERFWPLSRRRRPKQLLRLFGETTMIEQTVERLSGLVPHENILIVTNCEYAPMIAALFPGLPAENIIGEPCGRNTGPCVALAAGIIGARSGDNAVMCLLPADAMIRDAAGLRRTLADAAAYAGRHPDAMQTIGVPPTFPSTGYGYIHCGDRVEFDGETVLRRGLGFREKPDLETARKLLADGSYKWNSGMFLWTVGAIRRAFERHAPELAAAERRFFAAAAAGRLADALPQLYRECPKISIDFAVMEHLEQFTVAECRFDWDDVGSWPALRNHFQPDDAGNVAIGRFAGVDVTDSIIVSDDRHLVAAIDVANLAIIHTGDATLVAPLGSTQRIRELLQKIERIPELHDLL